MFNVDISRGCNRQEHTNVNARGALWGTQLSKLLIERSWSYPGRETSELTDNGHYESLVALLSKEGLVALLQ
jgi:hypothetical protein